MYRVGTTFFISLQSICDHLNCVERCRTLHTYTCRSSHNLCPLQLEKLPFQKNQQLLITLYNTHTRLYSYGTLGSTFLPLLFYTVYRKIVRYIYLSVTDYTYKWHTKQIIYSNSTRLVSFLILQFPPFSMFLLFGLLV